MVLQQIVRMGYFRLFRRTLFYLFGGQNLLQIDTMRSLYEACLKWAAEDKGRFKDRKLWMTMEELFRVRLSLVSNLIASFFG